MKIIIGADSAGFVLKAPIKKFLEEKGIEVHDIGIFYNENHELTDPAQRDYPLVARQVAEPVSKGEYDLGIILCGTGIGVGITANKVPGIRAATVVTHYEAKYTRLHNDANILCMGGRVIAPETALELVDIFISTEFEGGRHARRVAMIDEMLK